MENIYPGDYSKQRDAFASLLEMNTDPQQQVEKSRGRWAKRRSCELEPDELELQDIDDFAKPEYPHHIVVTPVSFIRKGNKVDIITLLSQTHLLRYKGDNVEIVEDVENRVMGKYVMICCFYVPVYQWGSVEIPLFDLWLLSDHLSCRSDFKMVLVVKMRPKWAHDRHAFRHFVSGFSESCLVVPFEQTNRVDYICKSMNLGKHVVSCLLVGPDGVVIQDSIYNVLGCVGKDIFPFTDDKRRLYSRYRWGHETLEEVLGCNVLYKNLPGIGPGPVSVSVSELEKKRVVGLYLCGRGYDIPLLDRVYNECRAKGLEFEIVLVYTPFIIPHNKPQVIQEVIGSFLSKRKISWWILPFSYFVCRRLFNLATCPLSDKLLILSHGKLVKSDGLLVLRSLGCEGYPFDRESIIERALEEVKRHTLMSLLAGGSLCRGNDPTHRVPLTALQRRNVLLCLGSAEKNVTMFELIHKYYDDIKKKHAGFELVFVNLDETTSPAGQECISYMPWLVCNPAPSLSESLVKAFSFWGRRWPDLFTECIWRRWPDLFTECTTCSKLFWLQGLSVL